MKFSNLRIWSLPALVTILLVAATPARADNMALIAIAPASGTVSLTPRWALGGGLSGFHLMAQDLSLGGGANQFYSIKGTPIPAGGDVAAFTRYIAGSGAATNHADIGSKLTPNSYTALTSADPDIGYGSVNFYLIHTKGTTDYFAVIKPSSATASAVLDLKPMSGPGGPATITGVSGYRGLTFAAANLGHGLNNFYYLRTDPVTGSTKFGVVEPALLGTAADKFDLGMGGHNALAFTGTDVGYGTDKMYYLRLDPITGFTILGTLHPVTGRASDIANLGSVYSTLTFVPGDVGFGSGRFYTTGAINPTWQSVSFAALADRAISAGSFTVTPSASSGLPIALTVVAGSTGAATISGPVAGVFSVTPTAPGVITLQATQAGQAGLYEFNMLRQSFTASGVATLAITSQPINQTAVAGITANFSVTATGTSALSYQWRKAGVNISGNASATTSTLALANVQAADASNYDVVVTNSSGSVVSNGVTLTVTTAAPIITNSSLTAAGTAGTAFSFTITASGSPTSYSASPLPAGLTINVATGAITGTPTAAGTTAVLLGATTATGTGNATLTVTVAGAGTAPIITNSPLTAGGTVGSPFSFMVTASGTPTSFSATTLPNGLTLVPATGVVTGTPTVVGTTAVLLNATNAFGTGSATLTLTIAPAGVAPLITNSPLTAPGTVGTPFSFAITATGSPAGYSASPLPVGLVLNPTTGTISGTPSSPGVTTTTLGAINGSGTGSATLTIIVAAAGSPPVVVTPFVTSAGTAPATVGVPFVTYLIAATGSPTSFAATGLPAGLTVNSFTGAISGTPTVAGTSVVSLAATNAAGTGVSSLVITVAPAVAAPIITSPLAAVGTAGQPFVTYLIAATGTPTTYTASGLPTGLALDPLTGAINGTPTTAGTYRVALTATNANGTTTTILTINVGARETSRIVNFSARALSGPGDQTLIMGFVVLGDGKNLLIRGIGPGLIPHGVVNVLADPLLTLYGPAGVMAANDDWQTTASGQATAAQVAATAARVGAFALPNGSRDSSLLASFNNGAHTTSMLRPASTTGVALTEIYDTDVLSGARLINVSARMNVTAGEGTLIAGVVISGQGPRTVLIRGVGPSLSAFAVAGVLADPLLVVYSGSTEIARNDNWGTSTAPIAATSAQVGAFALAPGSRDAALLLTLEPGNYTIHVTGVGNTSGVALVEVYDTY